MSGIDRSRLTIAAYAFHMTPWIVFSIIGMYVRNKTFHAVFAIGLFFSFVMWLTYSIVGILEIVQGGG